MKKLLLISSLALCISSFGQTVPNGDFESWTSIPYEQLNGWNSSNRHDVMTIGSPTITKVAGVTGNALRIETKVSGSDTSESYIISAVDPCSEPANWHGGFPFSQIPTAITGQFRYNLAGNDTALILVVFSKNGVQTAFNAIQIRGTGSQPAFASFSFPVTCPSAPDSAIIAFASSNKMTNIGVASGSYIEFDDLAFAGTSQPIPNGDFENWTSVTYDQASSWAGSGSSVTKSTNSFAGAYAVKLETAAGECGYISGSGITNGTNQPWSGPDGGQPYTQMMDTLYGYYMYAPVPNDTAYVNVQLTNNGSYVGGGLLKLSGASTYTLFKMPIQPFSAPDTMLISIGSSSMWPAPGPGSALYIDNLWLYSNPLGLFNSSKSNLPPVSLYPNPAKDFVNIKFGENLSGEKNIVVFNALGENVDSFKTTQNHLSIETSKFNPGIYFVRVKTASSSYTQKFVKE